jgi:hypothetical protein
MSKEKTNLKKFFIKANDLIVGDREISKVSVFEPNIIPGQKPGSNYYSRITSLNHITDVYEVEYIECKTACEDENFVEVPGLNSIRLYKKFEILSVLRKE